MTYRPEVKSLGDVPRYHASRCGERIALAFRGRRRSYAAWDADCSRVANALLRDGVTHQDRIAWLGRNSDVYFDLLFGAAKAGAVMVPLNWRLADSELRGVIEDAAPKVLFVESDFIGSIEAVAGGPRRPEVIVAGSGPDGLGTLEGWLAGVSAADPEVPVSEEDIFLQAYTSGTTGRPKGVQLAHRVVFAVERHRTIDPASWRADMGWIDWEEGEVSVVCMPVFHATGTGWAIAGFYAGATNVILPQYDVDDLAAAFDAWPVTRIVLVPTAIQQLLRHPGQQTLDFHSLRYLIYGASPIPTELLQEARERFGDVFIQAYGMTETNGGVTYLSTADHADPSGARLRSAGRALCGSKITIRDPSGQVLPPGETGEVCIETVTLMSGYWRQPEETARVISPDGVLRSGDAGYLDEAGYLFIQDRIKDMIITGGENVYPAEVENVLFGHPDVEEVCVVGVPDDRWGEAVKALVVPRRGAAADPAAIAAYARARLAGYKAPKSIELRDSLPKNATGKVLRRELRAAYWVGRERQVN